MHITNNIYNTAPVIVHAPGGLFSTNNVIRHTIFNPYWIPIIKNWEKETPGKCRKETKDELTIITWNNTNIKGSCEQSLERLGLDFLVLGKGMKNWRNTNKFTTALEIFDLIKTPYIMAADCFDAIFLRDPYEALEIFKAMDCEMLFNGEKNYYPDYGLDVTGKNSITDKWKKFEIDVAQSEWQFINSGAFIVKTPFYKEFLLKCIEHYDEIENKGISLPLPDNPVDKKNPSYKVSDSDQLITHWAHFDYYPRIKIDYRMDIFFNTYLTSLNEKTLTLRKDTFERDKKVKYETKTIIADYLLKCLHTKNIDRISAALMRIINKIKP